ncbi:MAG TPA: hypothetical protein VF629_07460 [Hymenobacter sp.]|jgi:hypothetical protein|uniref:hypothetical protein n=1 Tax=Hymenobacter sp. TaxID=1898978 RepID=UPI002EDB6729
MTHFRILAALLLALPLAATAQTTPASPKKTPPTTTTPTTPTKAPTPVNTTSAPQQVTETVEDLDPATGKVIRRTTRTTTVPAGTPLPGTTTAPSSPTEVADGTMATDAQVTAFLRTKTTVSTLTAPALVSAYSRFMEQVNASRHGWRSADWASAAAVLSSLNARYEQLRSNISFDDKVNIRAQQAEFQTLRTARQLSDQVSDKL